MDILVNFLMNTGRQQTHRLDSTDLARCPKRLHLHEPGFEIIVMQALTLHSSFVPLARRIYGDRDLMHKELGN